MNSKLTLFTIVAIAFAQSNRDKSDECNRQLDNTKSQCLQSYIQSIQSFYDRDGNYVSKNEGNFCSEPCRVDIKAGFEAVAPTCGPSKFPKHLFNQQNPQSDFINFQMSVYDSLCIRKNTTHSCAVDGFNLLKTVGAFDKEKVGKWFNGIRRIFSPMGFAGYFEESNIQKIDKLCDVCTKSLFQTTLTNLKNYPIVNETSDLFRKQKSTLDNSPRIFEEKCSLNSNSNLVSGSMKNSIALAVVVFSTFLLN